MPGSEVIWVGINRELRSSSFVVVMIVIKRSSADQIPAMNIM